MSARDRVRESVTCPQCGSLVPVGDRKCDNCGARQKDFAPAPTSYTRAPVVPSVPVAPSPVPFSSPMPSSPSGPPASAHVVGSPTDRPLAYRPLAYRVPGSESASAQVAHPVTLPPVVQQPESAPMVPGAHAKGVPLRTGAGVPAAGVGPETGTRSSTASRALFFAALPVGINVLGSALLIVIVTTGLSDIDGWGSVVLGLVVLGTLVVTGLSTIVMFVLAVVFGIGGIRETAGLDADGRRAVQGRGRAIAALLIVGAHLAAWALIGIAAAVTP